MLHSMSVIVGLSISAKTIGKPSNSVNDFNIISLNHLKIFYLNSRIKKKKFKNIKSNDFYKLHYK